MTNGKDYPISSQYRVFPVGYDQTVWFQSLGFIWQLYFFWSYTKTNDAGIIDINLIDFSRATGHPLPTHEGLENYIKCLNQDSLERVVLIGNGKKLLYPFVLWYSKGGVLNLSVEHDKACYEAWLLEEIPHDYIAAKFNIINEEDFDMETFMKNVDLNIRESVKIKPKYDELFPRSFVTHLKMPDGYIMHKQVNDFFDRIKKTYGNPPKKGDVAACYVTFYRWVHSYPNDIETCLKWIEKQRPKGYKYPPLQEFLSMRMYLNED